MSIRLVERLITGAGYIVFLGLTYAIIQTTEASIDLNSIEGFLNSDAWRLTIYGGLTATVGKHFL